MDREKNEFPWETMDTTVLMMPEELLAYHLYRLKLEETRKREKQIVNNRKTIVSYLVREKIEKEEKSRCFQK